MSDLLIMPLVVLPWGEIPIIVIVVVFKIIKNIFLYYFTHFLKIWNKIWILSHTSFFLWSTNIINYVSRYSNNKPYVFRLNLIEQSTSFF